MCTCVAWMAVKQTSNVVKSQLPLHACTVETCPIPQAFRYQGKESDFNLLDRERVAKNLVLAFLQGVPMQNFLPAEKFAATWCGTFACSAKQGPHKRNSLKTCCMLCMLTGKLKLAHFYRICMLFHLVAGRPTRNQASRGDGS